MGGGGGYALSPSGTILNRADKPVSGIGLSPRATDSSVIVGCECKSLYSASDLYFC